MAFRSKNILIVTHHYPPHITGVGSIAQNHAKRLAALGHTVTVITSDTDPLEKSRFLDGVNVIRVKAWNISESWSAPFPIFSPTLLFVLFKYVPTADIVHIHDAFYISSFLGALIARLYKKPIVLTQHVALINHPNSLIVFIEKLVYATTGAMIFRWSNIILTYNDRVEQFLIGRGVPRQKLLVLKNGVDTDLFHPVSIEEKMALRRELGFDTTKKIILFVGRFVPKKGLDKVLLVRSDTYQILCAGGDIPEKPLDNIKFLGKLDRETLIKVYQAADIFLLPSESEGFPVSIQEAMASGLTIITTNDPGYEQYDLDKNLVSLIDIPNEISLRNAIHTIVQSDEALLNMSNYSRSYAQNYFSWSLIISQMEKIYEDVFNAVNKKNIAIVSDSIYPYFKGGKEKRIYEITTRLAAQGHHVTIYTMQWWKGDKTIIENGVTLHAISPLYPLYHEKRRSFKEAIFFSLNCFKLLNKKFDVIEIDHMPHLVLFPLKIVCLLKEKRMIVTWHEVWGKEYWKEYLGGGVGAWVAYYVEKLSARLPDLIISVSEHTTKSLRAGLGIKQPIVTINNGLDMVNLLSNKAAPVGADVIFAGRLLSHKNVDVLLRALKIVKDRNADISLSIIGEGPEKESLEELTKKLGLEKNVSFLGFLENQNDLYGIMQASRIFVLPSTREGFGIAALEANACGMPFITINHEQNAAKELIINRENGILVNLDAKQIANAIEELLNEKKGRSFYRAYAEKYDWNRIVPQIESVYNS